jgi:hypothetical protein
METLTSFPIPRPRFFNRAARGAPLFDRPGALLQTRQPVIAIMNMKITSLGVFAVLGLWCACVGAAQEPDATDAEWGMMIRPSGTLLIFHKGETVVSSAHVAWAEKSVWVDSKFGAALPHEGNAKLTGSVPGLDLKAEGAIRPLADNKLRVDYQFNASKEHSKIFGLVLDFKFSLNSPTFESKAADPVFLEDKTGWLWRVDGDNFIRVRFDEPLDKVIYEAGNKNHIRAFLFADEVRRGTRNIGYSVELPKGGRILTPPEERFGKSDTSAWFADALKWDDSPIDLSFLNAQDRPAGRRGFIKVDKDRFVFEDGTVGRFWGTNLAAAALFATPRQNVARQAHRLAQLGFNLVRIVQHDAPWTEPNIFAGHGRKNTGSLSNDSLEHIDWWIKCLKDEGIYIWLDLVYRRTLTDGDGVKAGFDEIKRHSGFVEGFNYFNAEVAELMRTFQRQYLSHVNRYTNLAYKDDPAVVGVLITNENDLTMHFGNLMLADKNNPVHNALFNKEVKLFSRTWQLSEDRLYQTWLPGPSKLVLNAVENRFNQVMIGDLRGLGVRAPLVTTSYWGGGSLFCLPSLTVGDVIDVHSYGNPESLSINPRYSANFIPWIGAARVEGKPLSITEWNTNFPIVDRFTAPLYLASIASLQGWDMPMFYDYSQRPLTAPGKAEWESRIDEWSSYNDPALFGVMPAAAVAYRRGHVSPARSHYCLMLTPAQLIDTDVNPNNSAAIRTLVEQSRLSIGMPAIKELPWLRPTEPPGDATVVNDPNHDFVPPGQSFVRSDTGEILRNWKYGVQTINTPKTQSVSGWVGGKTFRLGDATIRVVNPKAIVVLTSLDDKPLSSSQSILITALARAVGSTPGHTPFLSEPVVASIALKTSTPGLEFLALGSDGKAKERLVPTTSEQGLSVSLPTSRGTHWYLLKSRDTEAGEKPQAQTKAAQP